MRKAEDPMTILSELKSICIVAELILSGKPVNIYDQKDSDEDPYTIWTAMLKHEQKKFRIRETEEALVLQSTLIAGVALSLPRPSITKTAEKNFLESWREENA